MPVSRWSWIHLFAAFSPDFTLPSLFRCNTAGDRNEDPDYHVVLPSATTVWAQLPKILTLGDDMPQIVVWLKFSPTLIFDWCCPLDISTLDLINSPLTVFVCWALLSPSCWKTALTEGLFAAFFSAETFELHHFLNSSQKFSDWGSSCQAQFIWSGAVYKMYWSKDYRDSYPPRQAFLSR